MSNMAFIAEAPGIYMIKNPKDRVYIGQSVNIRSRIDHYEGLYCSDQPLLYNSLIKYGFKSHIVEVIVYCQTKVLNDLERLFIKKYKSNKKDYGLNLTSGGRDYFKHSEHVRKKMSLAQMGNQKTLGRKQSSQEIAKRVEKLKGQKRTQAQRRRISESLKGRKFSKEHRKSMSIAFKGRNAKKVIDTKTGKIYRSATKAAKETGINKSTLTAMLNGQNPNKTTLEYL